MREEGAKSVTLQGATIYFGAFDETPQFGSGNGDLESVEISYNGTNLIGAIDDVRIALAITRDGEPVDELTLLSLSQLSSG